MAGGRWGEGGVRMFVFVMGGGRFVFVIGRLYGIESLNGDGMGPCEVAVLELSL